jgi:hypothetical protein
VTRLTGRAILAGPLGCTWPRWSRTQMPEACEGCGQPVVPPRGVPPEWLRVAWVEHSDYHESCRAAAVPHTRADCWVMRKAGHLVRGKIADEPDPLDLDPWDLGPATEVPPAEGPGR